MRHRATLATTIALLFGAGAACSDAPTGPAATDAGLDDALSPGVSAQLQDAPGAPEPIEFSNTFPGEDACTGEPQITTIAGTIWVHQLPNGNQVVRWDRTITTDTGYEGHGVRTEVNNGNVYKLSNNDIVSHPDGRRFLAHGVMVVDLTTSPPTARVSMGGFTCLSS